MCGRISLEDLEGSIPFKDRPQKKCHRGCKTLGIHIELLKITYDTLILQITSKSFLKDNVPYEYSVTSWIGDAIRLEVDVEDIEHGITFLK